MRVLVVNRFWKQAGGVEACARDLQSLLEERGHEVVPFAMADQANWPTPYAEHFASHVDFYACDLATRARAVWRATASTDSIAALRGLLDEVPIDAAHVFNTYHYLGPRVLLELRRRAIPIILSLHDYKVACPNAILYSERTRRVCTVCMDHHGAYLWAPPVMRCRGSSVTKGLVLSAEAVSTHLTGAYRRAPSVFTVLNSLQHRALMSSGVGPDRVHLVPNPVELGEMPTSGRGRHVLFVGRLTPLKGVDVLIRACALHQLPLRVVGDGPERSRLEEVARDVNGDVTFVGGIPAVDVHGEMRAAAVLGAPSLSPDVAPLVIPEAWSNGLPVVGSDIGGIPDFLAEGRGLICPPDDEHALGAALEAVVKDPDLGAALVTSARDYATAQLNRDRWTARMRDVYEHAGVSL